MNVDDEPHAPALAEVHEDGEELSPERARALFQRALDEELSPTQLAAFERTLAARPELAEELAALRRVMRATAELANSAPSVDLLASVQNKLRSRSGGRFYRDRFAERRGIAALLPWAVGGSILVVLATVLWFGFEFGLFPR
jgi:anti-sigma factor RsiW